MQTIRRMLMHYLVKVVAPQSPAYGNTIHFVKQQSLQEIKSQLQIGDIIFTKTNNSMYQACRKLLKINYDHVSVVINKNQVIHISPPIICKLQTQVIMASSRQPLVLRFESQEINKEVFLNILLNFIGEKYNQTAIPLMIKNQVVSRLLQAQQDHNFTFQNLKYSKICTEAILYALCKANQKLQVNLTQYVNNQTQYKKLGYIMPDQMISYLEQNGAKIIYKSPETSQKTLLNKFQDSIENVIQKFSFMENLTNRSSISPKQMYQIAKKMVAISNQLLKKHPILKTLSMIVFFYQIFHGNKFNKVLLLYSIASTLIMFRAMPQISETLSIKNSKL